MLKKRVMPTLRLFNDPSSTPLLSAMPRFAQSSASEFASTSMEPRNSNALSV